MLLTRISGCLFCPGGTKSIPEEEIIARRGGWYLAESLASPCALLIVPNVHVETIDDMGTFIRAVGDFSELKELFERALQELGVVDNLSINLTMAGGQKEHHCHIWVMKRGPGDPNLGMNGLLVQNREQRARIKELEEELARQRAALHALESELSRR